MLARSPQLSAKVRLPSPKVKAMAMASLLPVSASGMVAWQSPSPLPERPSAYSLPPDALSQPQARVLSLSALSYSKSPG